MFSYKQILKTRKSQCLLGI